MSGPRLLLEPEAVGDAKRTEHPADFNAASLRSAAISLKRIADALEHLLAAHPLDATFPPKGDA